MPIATDNAISPDRAMRQAGEMDDIGEITMAMKMEMEAWANGIAGSPAMTAQPARWIKTTMLPQKRDLLAYGKFHRFMTRDNPLHWQSVCAGGFAFTGGARKGARHAGKMNAFAMPSVRLQPLLDHVQQALSD